MRDLTTEEKATNHETWRHINRVQQLMAEVANRIIGRLLVHDQSKLSPPEVEAFTVVTPRLRGSVYGSDEYKATLKEIAPAIAHHNANNSHHPEHYAEGVDGMDLLDLVEMLCDWKAAGERHETGNIWRSIEFNSDRFKISPQLRSILENTARKMWP